MYLLTTFYKTWYCTVLKHTHLLCRDYALNSLIQISSSLSKWEYLHQHVFSYPNFLCSFFSFLYFTSLLFSHIPFTQTINRMILFLLLGSIKYLVTSIKYKLNIGLIILMTLLQKNNIMKLTVGWKERVIQDIVQDTNN